MTVSLLTVRSNMVTRHRGLRRLSKQDRVRKNFALHSIRSVRAFGTTCAALEKRFDRLQIQQKDTLTNMSKRSEAKLALFSLIQIFPLIHIMVNRRLCDIYQRHLALHHSLGGLEVINKLEVFFGRRGLLFLIKI